MIRADPGFIARVGEDEVSERRINGDFIILLPCKTIASTIRMLPFDGNDTVLAPMQAKGCSSRN